MDQLAKEQAIVGQELQQIVKNYKKDPADRKTLKYYEERLRRLESSWDTFDSNDRQIKALPDLSTSHDYFADQYYNAIYSIYISFRDHFSKKITSLQLLESPVTTNDDLHKDKSASVEGIQIQNPPGTMNNTDEVQKNLQGSFKVISFESPPQQQLYAASTNLSRVIRRQGAVIQSLRRLINNIHDTVDSPQQYYEIKLTTLNQYWRQIEEHNHNIWELTEDPSSAGYDIDEYLSLEEEVQRIQIELKVKLDKSSNQLANTLSAKAPEINTSLKLPKLTLPKFDGDYLKWRQFADLFKEMVHKQTMANVQKMWYLKMNVVGEAEKLIRHLTLSEDNYSAAWNMLNDRYENRRLLVGALVNKLLTQPSHASEGASAVNIKNLHDTTQECLMGLENLDIPTKNWDPILLHILIKKLDRTTHTLYEQALPNPREVQTIEKFLQFLQIRFQSLEALGNKPKYLEDYQRRYSAAKSLWSVIKPRSSASPTTCVCCKGHHPLFACGLFLKLSVNDRLHVLRKHNLCINCLKSGHSAQKCSGRSCTKCNKRHNTLVHTYITDKAEITTGSISTAATTSKPSNLTSNFIKSSEDRPTVATLTNNHQQRYVLLGTVRVKLINNDGKAIECRAVLDSGSQVNLITEKLAKKLNLRASNEPLCIQGIGNKSHQTQHRINVEMQSTTNAFTSRVDAFVLPNIISYQPAEEIDTSTSS